MQNARTSKGEDCILRETLERSEGLLTLSCSGLLLKGARLQRQREQTGYPLIPQEPYKIKRVVSIKRLTKLVSLIIHVQQLCYTCLTGLCKMVCLGVGVKLSFYKAAFITLM